VNAAETKGPGAVSVVVCNYNGAEHLESCLQALLEQTRPPDELLVVDNASTDGSLALVRERFPTAHVLALPENDGPCPARNAGLRAALHRWVLLVDNDAVLGPDVLAKLAAAAAARPDACVLQPRSVLADAPETVHYDGGRLHYAGLFSLRNFYTPLARAEGQGTIEVDGVISVVLLCDRERVLAAGGFDEGFFILFEDLDLSLRLRGAGQVLLSVEDALVLHRGGTPGLSFREGTRADYPAQRAFFHSRNRWLVLAKNYRWRTLLVALPGILAYELVWLAFTLESGGFWAHLRGKWAFLRQLGGALAQRAQIQAARVLPDRELLVGGPLTVSPQLVARAFPRAVLVLLDAWLALWWRLVRRLAG
jgi:GT2 family glycosyltransferase